jgi:hypothetical protein
VLPLPLPLPATPPTPATLTLALVGEAEVAPSPSWQRAAASRSTASAAEMQPAGAMTPNGSRSMAARAAGSCARLARMPTTWWTMPAGPDRHGGKSCKCRHGAWCGQSVLTLVRKLPHLHGAKAYRNKLRQGTCLINQPAC